MAKLADNPAVRWLVQPLPSTNAKHDHPRQKGMVNLPSSQPNTALQREFAARTLRLWDPNHFVIYGPQHSALGQASSFSARRLVA